MSKLFLASKFSLVASQFLVMCSTAPNKMRVLFVSTAAKPYAETPWLAEDRAALASLGFSVIDFDIEGKLESELRAALESCDVLFIGGGNTNYLLKIAKETGFEQQVYDFVNSGRVYVGSSAGAVVAGPTTEPFWESERPDLSADFVPSNFEAFGLVDVVLLPHANKPVYAAEYAEFVVPKYSAVYTLLELRDTEALIVEGRNWQRVSV